MSVRVDRSMWVTCPACGRQSVAPSGATEIVCDCGHRFDPSERPTRADPFVGATLDGYRFDAWIGGGAMGSVYRARQLSLNRDVAIKVLPAELARDPSFVARFHREARALAALNHPHIVQVFDRGEVDGRLFLVMEFVDGRNLRDCLRDGGFEPAEAVRIVAALAGALDYAHERGIVHRDIKPENVLISREGIVKVADFGLSHVLGSDAFDTRLTRTNVVLGTFEYMAPEQRESGPGAPDGRADIYAASVVLYELLTGELPIGRFALPSEKTPQLDRRLDAIVDRGLAKDPDDRFERASSMGRALEALLSTPGAPVMAPEVDLSRRGGPARTRETAPHAPSRFEWRLDLLLTVLAGCGVVLSLVAGWFLFDQQHFEFGVVDLDRDVSGLVLLVFGLLLWNSAERARRHWPGARLMLLALTLLAGLTLVALPITVWTWMTLLAPGMRRYIDARYRGATESEAAALAQGYAIERRGAQEALERRRKMISLNKIVASWQFALAIGCGFLWLLGWQGSPRAFKDEGAAVLALAAFFLNVGFLFRALAYALAHNRWLRLHSFVWTLLAPFAPQAAGRARALARDQRDGLLQ